MLILIAVTGLVIGLVGILVLRQKAESLSVEHIPEIGISPIGTKGIAKCEFNADAYVELIQIYGTPLLTCNPIPERDINKHRFVFGVKGKSVLAGEVINGWSEINERRRKYFYPGFINAIISGGQPSVVEFDHYSRTVKIGKILGRVAMGISRNLWPLSFYEGGELGLHSIMLAFHHAALLPNGKESSDANQGSQSRENDRKYIPAISRFRQYLHLINPAIRVCLAVIFFGLGCGALWFGIGSDSGRRFSLGLIGGFVAFELCFAIVCDWIFLLSGR